MYLNKIFSEGAPKKDPAVWIVLFTPEQKFSLASLLTLHRKNFDHVAALSYNKYLGSWFVVDWCSYGLWAEPITKEEVDVILSAGIQNNWPMVKYISKSYNSFPLFGTHCVNAVKHLLGIRSWAITPYQLYCALKKNGAEEIV